MRRRDFLRSTALAAAALGTGGAAGTALASPAVIKRTRELIVASPWRQSASGYSDLAFGFTRNLENAFGGRIKCTVETKQGGSIDVLNSGEADLYIGFEHQNVPHHAAFGYFAGLPGALGLDAATFADWLAGGNGQALWDECSSPYGIKSLMIAHTAAGGGLWSIGNLREFSGKRIAAQGLARDVLKGLGAAVTEPGLSDAGIALSSGALDAIEMSHIVEALETGVAQAANLAILPGLTQGGSTLAVSVKRELWDGLDSEAQGRVADVAAATCRQASKNLQANDRALRAVLSGASGTSFEPPSAALMTGITRVAEAVVADIAARDALSRRINGSYMAVGSHQGSAKLA